MCKIYSALKKGKKERWERKEKTNSLMILLKGFYVVLNGSTG